MPLPSISTACGSWDGFENSTVTLPAEVESVDSVNFLAPPGSAEIFNVAPPPPDEDDPEDLPYAPPPLEDPLLLVLLSSPHAANSTATEAAAITAIRLIPGDT